jgi:hypothetical protein
MSVIRIRSIEHPMAEPNGALRAARVIGRLEAMGLLPAGMTVTRLDRDTLRAALGPLVELGIGRETVLRLGADDVPAEEYAGLLTRLADELAASPVPQSEWAAVGDVLGVDLLLQLTATSPASLRRYTTGTRTTPAALAARLHFLALLVSDLTGSYNDYGVRRWFHRPRSQLDGATPAQLLCGAWDPEDEGPRRVAALASALVDGSAT